MKRREFLKKYISFVISTAALYWVNIPAQLHADNENTRSSQEVLVACDPTQQYLTEARIKKSIHFDKDYKDDVFIAKSDRRILRSVSSRLRRLQNTIGYRQFNIVGYDEALAYPKRYPDIGAFTSQELAFIERVFFTDAHCYGFHGKKVVETLNNVYTKNDVQRIPQTAHYLLKGKSLNVYQQLRHDIGKTIILTSGLRGNIKQLSIFLGKVIRVNSNLSRASRSVAPPGYSYHAVGDFDVGIAGWGNRNFSIDFAMTEEYKRMQELGYGLVG